jgi:RNA polymerase sigma-70 factor (ECF subfamily)
MDFEGTSAGVDVVKEALSAARVSWPTLQFVEHEFRAYLKQVGSDTVAIGANGIDLALACACARGDAVALSIFEGLYVRNIDLFVARLGLSPDQLEELRQLVRVRLFTGGTPRIAHFSGKGPLGAWLRVLCLRIAMDHLKVQPRDLRVDSKVLETLVAGSRPADDADLRRAWEPLLRQVTEETLAELPPREKTILRLHYLEGLNIEAIGTIYGVHRATVARWLLAIRARVLNKIRERLAIQMPATTSEFRGVFAALQSELHVSLSRVLAAR